MNQFENNSVFKAVIQTDEVVWLNPDYQAFDETTKKLDLSLADVMDAEERLKRFEPYLRKVFPETDGIIESEIRPIPKMQEALEEQLNEHIPGNLYLKCDHALPISGSIKARGGIYAVLKHAEDLAVDSGLLALTDNYSVLCSRQFQDFYSEYTLSVGSTGNLGLSIGIMGRKLGFKVIVHMSKDAMEWKKALLRSLGVKVIEHESDYTEAVKAGRIQAETDPKNYFIDDENSRELFLGYAVAALRLKKQLSELNIKVDKNHPLFVFLPCGVGGGPGGVTFGLKQIFKDDVHCFLAEPTHSPSMLLGLLTGLHDEVSVQDFGIDNKTMADGLAVGRPSGFVGKLINNLISGMYTVSDEHLIQLLVLMKDKEALALEPSALAGIPVHLFNDSAFKNFIRDHAIDLEAGTHICWSTGGSMVPNEVMKDYYQMGKKKTPAVRESCQTLF